MTLLMLYYFFLNEFPTLYSENNTQCNTIFSAFHNFSNILHLKRKLLRLLVAPAFRPYPKYIYKLNIQYPVAFAVKVCQFVDKCWFIFLFCFC